MKEAFCIDLSAVGEDNDWLVGPEALLFHKLQTAGISIFPGFVITSAAFAEFARENNLVFKLKTAKNRRALLSKCFLPEQVASEIITNYFSFQKATKGFFVGIHASSPLVKMTFSLSGGRFSTLTSGEAELLELVKQCWIKFIEVSGQVLPKEALLPPPAGIIIQHYQPPKTHGVVYSQNPLTGDLQEVVIKIKLKDSKKDLTSIIDKDSNVVKKVLTDGAILSSDEATHQLTAAHQRHLTTWIDWCAKSQYFPQKAEFYVLADTSLILDLPQNIDSTLSAKTKREKYSEQLSLIKLFLQCSQINQPLNQKVRDCSAGAILPGDLLYQDYGVHPKNILSAGKRHDFLEKSSSALTNWCQTFLPKTVFYAFSNAGTDFYRTLKGGNFEPPTETSQLGFAGAERYLVWHDVLEMELELIKLVRQKENLKNLSLILPFCSTQDELSNFLAKLNQQELSRAFSLHLFLTVETPSALYYLDKLKTYGIEGIYLNLKNLTELTLGKKIFFDATDGHLKEVLDLKIALAKKVIASCQQQKIFVIIPDIIDQTDLLENTVLLAPTGCGLAYEPQFLNLALEQINYLELQMEKSIREKINRKTMKLTNPTHKII